MSDNKNTNPLATNDNAAPATRLSMQNLGKRYGKRWVVKDVSFSVEQGQVVGLLGPNGAGKTTSFYMVVGLVNMDKGLSLIHI